MERRTFSAAAVDTGRPQRRLLTAEAFGFGPASKLLVFADLLALGGAGSTFAGDGCALELAGRGGFGRVVQLDPSASKARGLFARLMREHDVFITAMEFSLLGLARQQGLTTVVIDSLLWFWNGLPFAPADVDLYVCQNFLGVRERAEAYGLRDRLVVVPPLTLSQGALGAKDEHIVLNLGGMDNPFAASSAILDYATTMVEIVIGAAATTKQRLHVYGRSWVMEALKQQFADEVASGDVCFRSAQLDHFLDDLACAKFLVTSPGLEVIYEAFTLGIPTFLLPAQNNSQLEQASRLAPHLNAHAQAPSALQWRDLYDLDIDPLRDPPAAAIAGILGCARRFKEDPTARAVLRDALSRFVATSKAGQALQIAAQKEIVDAMRRSADVHNAMDLQVRFDATLAQSA